MAPALQRDFETSRDPGQAEAEEGLTEPAGWLQLFQGAQLHFKLEV